MTVLDAIKANLEEWNECLAKTFPDAKRTSVEAETDRQLSGAGARLEVAMDILHIATFYITDKEWETHHQPGRKVGNDGQLLLFNCFHNCRLDMASCIPHWESMSEEKQKEFLCPKTNKP